MSNKKDRDIVINARYSETRILGITVSGESGLTDQEIVDRLNDGTLTISGHDICDEKAEETVTDIFQNETEDSSGNYSDFSLEDENFTSLDELNNLTLCNDIEALRKEINDENCARPSATVRLLKSHLAYLLAEQAKRCRQFPDDQD